jgi:hypothetical protein
MTDHTEWLTDKNANRWEMPVAPWWKRLPVIRHIRSVALKWKVERHYSVGMGVFGLRTGYDDWVLYGIWHGLERKDHEDD